MPLCGQSPLNIPIAADICFSKTATVTQKVDYIFLSAGQTFTLAPDVNIPMCWSNDVYTFPGHFFTFLNDFAKSGYTTVLSAGSFIIKDVDVPISATSFAPYFSAFNRRDSSTESQVIKTYFTPQGTNFYINQTTGEIYNVKGADWSSTTCPKAPVANISVSASSLSVNTEGRTFSAINNKLAVFGTPPGVYVQITSTNETHSMSGGLNRLNYSQSFTIPGGSYHTLDIVLLSGGTASINNWFRLSIDDTQGQRSKSYQASQYASLNYFLPALTISAISGNPVIMWDGLII